ncbi:MAG: hypothetical protein ACHQ52_05100 [Candidatus Eisenbacteria bacterium]
MGAGCRQALTPPTEDNKPPETWITAAPFDTITLDKNGNQPSPSFIPVRFHVYWAGSDEDGAVAGFYWAVTETVPTPPEGLTQPPQLPGPKPQDYHYITRTDSTFIFNVAEDIPDREHVFYIYAVDNKGKPDPTPARFVFTALDQFPPIPLIQGPNGIRKYGSYGVGTTYFLDAGGNLAARQDTFFVQDVDLGSQNKLPRDTVASNSTMHFNWSSRPAIPGGVITGYAYKLDEPDFVRVPSTVTHADYHTGVGADVVPLASGTKIFKLKAIDQAGGTNDSTRRFELNFSPDTWWAGPDPSSPSWRINGRGEKYVYVPSLGPAGIVGTLMSPDSVNILPARRAVHRSFLEFWNDTLFYRAEFDTVHMNSYAIFFNGGFDRDSPYLVRVSALAEGLPGFPGGVVLTPDKSPNGSPIGFRSRVMVLLDPTQDGYVSSYAQTGLFPLFDPNDVFDLPKIAVYHPMTFSGKAYVLSKAEDGDGSRDQRVDDPHQLVEDCGNQQSGHRGQSDCSLRPLVMTFYVNRPPYFLTNLPTFTPLPGHVFTDLNWTLDLPAFDEDPVDPSTPRGNSSNVLTLRRRITLRGKDTSGNDLVVHDASWPVGSPNTENINFIITAPLAPGPATLDVEVCDCLLCEEFRGTGRCVTLSIPVVYAPPSPTSAVLDRPGPK